MISGMSKHARVGISGTVVKYCQVLFQQTINTLTFVLHIRRWRGGLHINICTVSVKLLDKSTDSKAKILSYTCLHIVRQVSEYREEACD